jgi:hypothetical protein
MNNNSKLSESQNIKYIIALFMPLLIFLAGYTHYYYVPNVQNIPLFREKNEFCFSLLSGGAEESCSFELQSACAAGKNIEIMANFISAGGGEKS